MSELLALAGVCKGYARGERTMRVLADASLALGAGQVAAVVGSRQVGKTTLLKIAAGIEAPDAGEVRLDGTDLARSSDEERARLLGDRIAWIHSEGTGVKLRTLDYVGLPLAIGRGRRRREAQDLAMEALERVGAASCAGQHWAELSNWERLLVSLARGTSGSPTLLVVDDMMNGFGMSRTREAGELLLALAGELRCGVLMSCTDLEAALAADRVWSLEGGQLSLLSEREAAQAEVIDFPGAAGRRQSSRGVGH
jgi:predicted ABC-type transport system involved in lysophospholipase L1 biosynthesis ATPase subunit